MPKHRKAKDAKPNPPIMSQEFIIQNHGDIVSLVCIIILIGLVFPITRDYASIFVLPHYKENATNETVELASSNEGKVVEITKQSFIYDKGLKDLFTLFFYTCLCIVFHALAQEYILERIYRKSHASKYRSNKFYEAGILTIFYTLSLISGIIIIISEHFMNGINISSLWVGFPTEHRKMDFTIKIYYLFQISYWFHSYPELYLLKIPSDFILQRVLMYSTSLILTLLCYTLSLHKIGIWLLTLYALPQIFASFGKVFHYLGRDEDALTFFKKLWIPSFYICRMTSIILSFIVFYYGFKKNVSMPITLVLLISSLIVQLVLSYNGYSAWRRAKLSKKNK